MKNLLSRLRFERLLLLLVLALMVGILMVQANPLRTLPSRDSGFFMYAGSQILDGNLPYIDFWDSKGPGIFYINALGLFLGKGYRWGVWLLEYFLLLISSYLFHQAVEKKWGVGAAFFSNAAWLYGLSRVWEGGNLTEEYSLFFSFILISYFLTQTSRNSFYDKEHKGSESKNQNPRLFLRSTWCPSWLESFCFDCNNLISKFLKTDRKLYILLGATFALSFLFRANNTGVQIALLLALLLSSLWQHKYRQIIEILGFASISAGAILALLSGYFLRLGNLSEMFEAAIIYNFFYSGAANKFQLNFWQGIEQIGWPTYIAISGYLSITYQIIRRNTTLPSATLTLFLLVGFPLEVFLSSLSGKGYLHYFISWMPILALLVVVAYAAFSKTIFSSQLLEILNHRYKSLLLVVFIFFFAYWITGSAKEYQETARRILFERGKGIEQVDSVASYLRTNTIEDDTILVWGAYPGINFLAKRDAPTPYLFYPAYEESPFLEKMSFSLWQDISSTPPKMIVDAYSASPDYILSLDPVIRQSQLEYTSTRVYSPPYQDRVFTFVEEYYRRMNTINGFDIYLLNSQ